MIHGSCFLRSQCLRKGATGFDNLKTIDKYRMKGYAQVRVSFSDQKVIADQVTSIPDTLAVFAITGWRDLLVIWAGNKEEKFYNMLDSLNKIPGISDMIHGKSYVFDAE